MIEISKQYELIISSMRILSLLEGFKSAKSYPMNFDKLILLDFYMKFPQTMINEAENNGEFDFEELYSFYHAHPDRENYHKCLKFLISKQLITKSIKKSSFVYNITELGIQTVTEIENPFAQKMRDNSSIIKKTISKLNETEIKKQINLKSLNNMNLI